MRNEAWILIKNIIPIIQIENINIPANEILKLQKQNEYSPCFHTGDDCEWIRFWQDVCKCVKEYLKNK